MQPRVLVRQQGQRKKRFISPTQIKNNQAMFGDPLGSSKQIPLSQPGSINRLYSPQHQQNSIESQNRQRSKLANEKVAHEQVRRTVQGKNVHQQKYEHQTVKSNTHLQKVQLSSNKLSNRQSSSKGKSVVKKDYMMTSLAKLNNNNKKGNDKNQEQSSNGSQSRQKIDSYKNQRTKKATAIIDEYNNKNRNLYNQKQMQVKRRPINDGSRTSNRGSDNNFQQHSSSEQFAEERYVNHSEHNRNLQTARSQEELRIHFAKRGANQTLYHKQVQNKQYQKVNAPQKIVQPIIQRQKQRDNQTFYLEDNLQSQKKPQSLYINIPSSYDKQLTNQGHNKAQPQSPRQYKPFHQKQKPQSKPSFTNPPSDNFHQNRPSQIDPNNSSLAIYLKQAHQEKQQIRQKKFMIQRQLNNYKHQNQQLESNLNQMRRQMQILRIQNKKLDSELKGIKQFQIRTKNMTKDNNMQNEGLYRDIHQKYDALVGEHKRVVARNDCMHQECQKYKIELVNMERKLKLSEGKYSHLQTQYHTLHQDYRVGVRQTVQHLNNKLELAQRELRKTQNSTHPDNISGSNLGQIKIKMIQIQSELNHKTQLLNKRDEQIKSVRKQLSNVIQNLEEVIHQRQNQLKQLRSQGPKIQKIFTQKSRQYEEQIKTSQLKLAKCEKELHLKNLQMQDIQKSLTKQSQVNHLQKAYPVQARHTNEAIEAKSTFQSLVSTQTSQVNHYKKQLSKRLQQNFELVNTLQEQKSKSSNIQQQLRILQMQYASLEKKSSQISTTEVFMLKGQLQIAGRKQKQLEEKIERKVKQVKQKDEFIQSQLLRVTKEQNVPKLLDALKGIAQRIK